MVTFLSLILASQLSWSGPTLREVSSTSCKAIPIELGVGMTTQIVFEQEPKVTLFADQTHFKVVTNSSANRSIAIIPVISSSEIDTLKNGRALSSAGLAAVLNESIKTNLFVFFENNNQLMFELRFTDKKNADYLVKVKQVFNNGCTL